MVQFNGPLGALPLGDPSELGQGFILLSARHGVSPPGEGVWPGQQPRSLGTESCLPAVGPD